MSYENNRCPCGGRKECDTFLCSECEEEFGNRREFAEYQDGSLRLDYRRGAALVLVSLSRARGRARVGQGSLALNHRLF